MKVPAFSNDKNNCGHWGMDITGKCKSCGSYGGLKKTKTITDILTDKKKSIIHHDCSIDYSRKCDCGAYKWLEEIKKDFGL